MFTVTKKQPGEMFQNNCHVNIYVDHATILLTHWSRVTHICVGKLTIIGSNNGLSPGRHQAIILTNVGKLLIGPLGLNFGKILIELNTYSFNKTHIKTVLQNGVYLVSASMS